MPQQASDALAFDVRRRRVEMVERTLPVRAFDERAGVAEDEQALPRPGERPRQIGGVLAERHAAMGVTTRQAQDEHVALALTRLAGYGDLQRKWPLLQRGGSMRQPCLLYTSPSPRD